MSADGGPGPSGAVRPAPVADPAGPAGSPRPATPARRARRLVLLLPAGIALLLGLDAALGLLGLPQVLGPALRLERLPDVHGPLMVLGFVGTVIALERAVALGRPLGYLVPALTGLGALAVVGPVPLAVGQWLLVAAEVGFVVLYGRLHARQPAPAVAVQALGAVMALAAALLWAAGVPVPDLTPWLAGFLVLTIFGERLELARLELAGPAAARAALAVACLLLTGAAVSLLAPAAGFTVVGLALLAAALWLAAKDVARRTVQATGLPRFVAANLLLGYGWLAVGGAVWALGGAVTEGRGYDAVLHAIMLGFVVAMIMAHAPVIFPAVLRRPLPYHPVMYGPAALLHASLLLRLAVGDARDLTWAVQVGGVLNIVAVLAFVAVTVWSVARGARR